MIVKNTRVFGGEWVLSPDAAHDDGAFEVVPIAGRRDFTSKMLATYRHSPINEDDLRQLGIEHSVPISASNITFTVIHPGAEEPPPAQIDGEEFPRRRQIPRRGPRASTETDRPREARRLAI